MGFCAAICFSAHPPPTLSPAQDAEEAILLAVSVTMMHRLRPGFFLRGEFPVGGIVRFCAIVALAASAAGASSHESEATVPPLASLNAVALRATPQVERVSLTERSDGKGYVIRFHTDGPVAAYSEPRMLADGQMEVILFNTRLASDHVRGDAAGPVIRYSGEEDEGHLFFRFMLDAGQPLQASAYRDGGSDDILVGLAYVSGQAVSRREEGRDLRQIPVRAVSLLATASTDQLPAIGGGTTGRTREALLASRREEAVPTGGQWLLDTVVIDAGHGGKDPGTKRPGIFEKDITLAVSLKLGAYLAERLGVRVEYTRQDDRFIELKDRGRIANERGGKLFISIHVNSADNAAASGAETYFIGLHKTDAARSTMERENEAVKMESSQREYEDMNEEALIRMALTQSAYMQQSQELAVLIQDQFEKRVQRKNRGVKQAGFYVLWGASMPAVLVELGFLSNRSEAAFLVSERGQDYLASAIFRAVRAYKEQYDKGLGPRASVP